MRSDGVYVTGEQCSIKFRNLKRSFTECEDNNKSTGRAPKKCDFYEELKTIFMTSDVVQPRVLCSSRPGIKCKMLQPEDNVNPIEADDDNEVADQDKTQNEKTDSAEDRKRVRKGRSAYESYNQSLQKFMVQRNAENARFVEFMNDMKEQQQQKTAMFGQLINIFQNLADKN